MENPHSWYVHPQKEFSCLDKSVDHSSNQLEDYLFLPEFEGRRHAMRVMSSMFQYLLKKCNLLTDRDGHKCTSYSLRHTSIVLNLLNSEVTPMQIARRADTSLKMIDEFYYPITQMNSDLEEYLRI